MSTRLIRVGQFITFGTQVVAEAMASAPNYYKAKIACGRILKLIQMTPTIKRNQGTKIPTVITTKKLYNNALLVPIYICIFNRII